MTSTIKYWQNYAIQVATYAGAVPYDTDTEQRSEWPWPVDQHHGLIAHVDVLGALNGQPSATLVHVDLDAGREGADLVMAAKAWGKRRDLFTVGSKISPAGADDREASGSVAVGVAAPSGGRSTPAGELDRDALVARYKALAPELQERFNDKGIAKGDLVAVAAALDELENPPTMLERARERMATETKPPPPERDDEGGPANETDIAIARARYQLGITPEQRLWVDSIISGAKAAGRSIHILNKRTQRRADLYCAITQYAGCKHWDADNDDGFRAALYAVIGAEMCFWPTSTLGDLVSQLDARHAAELREVVDAIDQDLLVGAVDEVSGTLTWAPARVA